MRLRPWSDWLVVRAEPLAARSSVLAAAGSSDVRKGVVEAAGPGRPTSRGREPMEVGEGDRVAFFRWHSEHGPGRAAAEALTQLDLGEGRVLIRQADVLCVMEGCDPSIDRA